MKTKVLFDDDGFPKEMVIDRSEWLNGEIIQAKGYWRDKEEEEAESLEASLYNAKLCRGCCLGLLAACAGVPLKELVGTIMPRDVEDLLSTPLQELLINQSWREDELCSDMSMKNSLFAREAAEINDRKFIEPRERENVLFGKFYDAGVALSFVGELFPKEKEHV